MLPIKLLADLSSAIITDEHELQLKEAFGDTSHELVLEVVRTSWTLTYDVPGNYSKARCAQGHIDKNVSAEVMSPKNKTQL